MFNLYTNNEKQISYLYTSKEGNVWYQSVRDGKAYGRQFRMTEERFLTEFVPVIDWEPCETTDLTKKGGR